MYILENGPYIGAPMGINVGVFQVADAPTYGYVYTLPKLYAKGKRK